MRLTFYVVHMHAYNNEVRILFRCKAETMGKFLNESVLINYISALNPFTLFNIAEPQCQTTKLAPWATDQTLVEMKTMREGTGLGNWTLFCPVYPMPLDLGMCGGFPMSATGMERVSIFIAYSLTGCGYRWWRVKMQSFFYLLTVSWLILILWCSLDSCKLMSSSQGISSLHVTSSTSGYIIFYWWINMM